MFKSMKLSLLTGLLVSLGAATAQAETFKLRIASGHPAANTYVNLMTTFFVPEVTKRVAEKTQHKVEFIEGYGGAMVKVADTLEGVQSGVVDIDLSGYRHPENLDQLLYGVCAPLQILKVVILDFQYKGLLDHLLYGYEQFA